MNRQQLKSINALGLEGMSMVNHPRRIFLPLASLKAMAKPPKPPEPPPRGQEPPPAENDLLVKYYILTVA
jgi:hypothetical protein